MSYLLLIVIAILAGVAVALQAQFMGTMDRTVGTASSVFVTYGVGGITALLLWMARGSSLSAFSRIPWPAWSAGLLGLVIVGGIGYAAPRLGLSTTIVITVAAQLAAAAVIDHFALFGAAQRTFELTRAAGLAMTIGGVWLLVRS